MTPTSPPNNDAPPLLKQWKGVNWTAAEEAAAHASSVAEPPHPGDLPLWQLRDNLIDLTVALADELAADGDRDRLEALATLYEQTRTALRRRARRGLR